MIELQNVGFRYGETGENGIADVNLSIKKGEFVLLTGRSGCGKTTVTRCVNGLIPHFYEGNYEGTVLVNGKDISKLKLHEISEMVGSVFQDPRSQFFTTDMVSEVAFACENAGIPKDELRKRVDRAISELGIEHLRDRSLFELSSGERQKIAIASVYALRPEIYVFDEPSANLDARATEELTKTLTLLKSGGATVIISEHRLYYLRSLIDKVVYMDGGRVLREYSREEFLALTDAERTALGLRIVYQERLELPLQEPEKEAEFLRMSGLRFGYKKRIELLRDINCKVSKGEIIGVVGHNGAGKSTLAELLCGLIKEQQGAILIDSKQVAPKHRIPFSYFIMQDADYQLFSESVEDELALGNDGSPDVTQRSEKILELLDLKALRNRHPFALSGGQKQRVAIAAAYMKDLKVVVFDEPTSGLDAENMKRVSLLIQDLAQRGVAVFVITHDYELLVSTCKRIFHMENGRLSRDFRLTQDSFPQIKKIFGIGGAKFPEGGEFMKTEIVRKKGMARLLELAMIKKSLTITACALSIISVMVSFVPYVAIWFIIRELAAHLSDIGTADGTYLISMGWLAAGSAVGAIFLNFCALMCSHVAAFSTLYKLKLDFTRHIASLPLGFHSTNSTGKLRKIVDENIEKLESFIAHQLPDLAGAIAMPVTTLVILFIFDWRLGLASFVPILLAYFIQMSAMGSEAARNFVKKYQDSLEDMNNAAVEYVRGISVLKAFNQTIFSFRKFHELIKSYSKYISNYTDSFKNQYVLFMAVIQNIYLFLIPVIIWLSGGVQDYAKFAMAAVFYLIFSLSLYAPFVKVMYVSSIGKQVADGVERMDKILDVPPLREAQTAKIAQEYSVSFENVSFSYNEEGEAEAIADVSFFAKQGEVTALVGPSGSGKSTLAHLIPRFYDVSGGAIKIGGVDIRDMESEYLMSIVGFVFQDVFLFKQSILDNILIGNKSATRQQAIAAAKAAQCHEFIEKLPHGYDTVIGTKNVHLSGGERQRLVIARAILKDAPILVLDEATAFADPENEQKIQLAFEELMKNKTVIIIAHRLSTVRGANNIVVIDNGKVAEQGTHDKLLNTKGRYSRMWAQYTGAMNWSIDAKGGSSHA